MIKHLSAKHLPDNTGHLRNTVPYCLAQWLSTGMSARSLRPCQALQQPCWKAALGDRKQQAWFLSQIWAGPQERACQYLEAHLSTQLFSPTLRSPSLYLPWVTRAC